MERHFYRCLDCLEVQAVDGPQLRSVWNPAKNDHDWPQCDCGGKLKWMGKVKGLSLFQRRMACPCDGRCTGALGGNCDCTCGGKNHGTKRVVEIVVNVGQVPQIKPRSDLNERLARVAEFKAAKEAARARIAAKYGERYQDYRSGRYINGEVYFEIRDTCASLRKAASKASHKARLSALAKVAA